MSASRIALCISHYIMHLAAVLMFQKWRERQGCSACGTSRDRHRSRPPLRCATDAIANFKSDFGDVATYVPICCYDKCDGGKVGGRLSTPYIYGTSLMDVRTSARSSIRVPAHVPSPPPTNHKRHPGISTSK